MKMDIRLLFILFCVSYSSQKSDDYYELLGVTRDADNKEIRKAFKRLAVTLHPDKKKDDPKAHDVFVKLTRAYEVLKDPSQRKNYDLYGDEKTDYSRQNNQYHSYTYYRDHFGIYDDDPEIITLNKADFEANVIGSSLQWFVNFYSPLCSHCHELAPTWRALAKQLKGVVMFAAVNCEDDWALCRQQNIRSYPSLMFYPKGERYQGSRTEEKLFRYILNKVKVDVTYVSGGGDWDLIMNDEKQSSWILLLCNSDELPKCPVDDDRTKIAGVLAGLVGIAVVDCKKLAQCASLTGNTDSSVVFWQRVSASWSARSVRSDLSNAQDVLKEVLDFLPDLVQLDHESFKTMVTDLEQGSSLSWLVYFHIGAVTDFDMEVKKLSAMLPTMRVGRVNCGRSADVCVGMHISHYPSFVVFKRGGGHEFYHGQVTTHSVANFAKESAAATNLRTISQTDFSNLINGQDGKGQAWFIDFYAPWCPPCLRLLPELRKASRLFDASVRFGTVDCTVHADLCRRHNINSYPTTVLFNATRPVQMFRGRHAASSISEFLTEIVNPKLQDIDTEGFKKFITEKPESKMWFVSFVTDTCQNCQQLHYEMKKLAQLVSDFTFLSIGEVNCDTEVSVCNDNNIKFFPTLRLYPSGSKGIDGLVEYNGGYRRDHASLRRWLFHFLPDYVEELNPEQFDDNVMRKDDFWLVDFYSPSCGHCHVFAPDFTTIAYKMKDRVKCGKLDCQKYRNFCSRIGIHGYPTVMWYESSNRRNKGVEIATQSMNSIIELVESYLAKPGGAGLRHDEL
ncbi:dnaJ homolog subfamily C member 10 [Nilaparvata lugens]|uniref:dnaJ homolog subfamily C member 10 n=1 Tax=Nilaparvata lugens TaxID=108931 RepID=UPI00193CD939|nr:dnaJ homolog subfamily C member 10 [Nilaparvata lugens]